MLRKGLFLCASSGDASNRGPVGSITPSPMFNRNSAKHFATRNPADWVHFDGRDMRYALGEYILYRSKETQRDRTDASCAATTQMAANRGFAVLFQILVWSQPQAVEKWFAFLESVLLAIWHQEPSITNEASKFTSSSPASG